MSPRLELHKAAFKGNWDDAEEILKKNESLKSSAITDGGETALHIAAVQGHAHFVSKLLERIEVEDVKILNSNGCTALCFAAAAGHTHIARRIVKKNSSSVAVAHKGENGITPLYMAVMYCFRGMTHFLYPLSDFPSWNKKDQINLLTTAIHSQFYGLAKKIVMDRPGLAIAEDSNWETPLQVLARNPLGFRRNNAQGRFWLKIITTVAPYMRNAAAETESDGDAYTLLDALWNAAENTQLADATEVRKTVEAFFRAAESGNDDFLVEFIRRDPNFLLKVNDFGHTIFHIAVDRRYVKIFNLIYELGSLRDLITSYIDKDGNNILHLAAKLAPPDQLNTVPGAALQMQRELLWYKAVEKLVRPSYRNKQNHPLYLDYRRETPHELFLREHQDLMKEGEKFMKDAANSCMLVTTLIATVVFTTAFTVPGGYDNNTGVPILQNKKLFIIFPVSEAVATLSSLTSMFMFLSILTSRYSENDFLRALPFWLMVGLATLFVSTVAMMVAFCTCLLFFQHGGAAVTLLLVFFGSVPTMFVILKYSLLVSVLSYTYNCTWLFRSHDRLRS